MSISEQGPPPPGGPVLIPAGSSARISIAVRNAVAGLTEAAEKGDLLPVIGRDTETGQLVAMLSDKDAKVPVLACESAADRMAVAERLAQLIADGAVPEPLKDKRLRRADLSALAAALSPELIAGLDLVGYDYKVTAVRRDKESAI
jgi:ATP-dependent Clp protease ATP-binding subunit ClpC